MPGIDGLQTLEQLRQIKPGLRVVMLSCVSDTRKVVQAMRLGATDYLTKPFQKAELDSVISQCIGTPKGESYAGEVEELCDDVFFVAASPAMKKIRSQAALVANVDIPVLLLGESGTGKEVLARSDSQTFSAGAPHVPQSELRRRARRLAGKRIVRLRSRSVHGRQSRQARQVRALQQGHDPARRNRRNAAAPAGETAARASGPDFFASRAAGAVIKVDVRILAATNINIPEAIANKRLREDLYYRLNAFTLSLPPLRDRKEEIPILLKHFMSRMSESYARSPLPMGPALMEACLRHSWPGNLRELSNFIKRYLVLGDENLAASELQPRSDGGGGLQLDPSGRAAVAGADGAGGLKSLARSAKDEAEAEAIGRALEETNWNRKQAAALLQDQLQSAALQDPPVRDRAEPKHAQAVRGGLRAEPASALG